jgi:REP element-mobilizing transposase RayT
VVQTEKNDRIGEDMARKPRLIGEKLYHHVYAWGNDHHPIFKRRPHYETYLALAGEYALQYNVDVVAYALIWWHVHLFLFDLLGNLSRFMNSLHGRYAQYYNKSTGRVGHVFGERYNNRIVQTNEYGLWLSRYIHRQAVDAGLVESPRDYEWTSYLSYLGIAPIGFLKPGVILDQFGRGRQGIRSYESFVTDSEDGPVDWDVTTQSIVGCEQFQEEIKAKIMKRELEKNGIADLVEFASSQLSIDRSLLLEPRGWAERRARHRVFSLLVTEYGVSLRQVAKAFGVSPTAVLKAVADVREKRSDAKS